MKRILSVLLALVVWCGGGLLLTGCDKNKTIKDAYVKENTIVKVIERGATLDTGNAVLVVTYSDGKTEEIQSGSLQFSSFDTSKLGDQILSITYKGYTVRYRITVVMPGQLNETEINLLESALANEYEANRTTTDPDGEQNFVHQDEPLFIGTDNAFNLRLSALDRRGHGVANFSVVIASIKMVEADQETMQASDELTEVAEADYSTYFDFTAETGEFQFKKAAEEKVFEITVKPVLIASGRDKQTTVTVTGTVIPGYNVYDPKELVVMDETDRHNEIKEALGLTDVKPDIVILQADMHITKDDVGSAIFWQDDGSEVANRIRQLEENTGTKIFGTPKDDSGTGLYKRVVEVDKQFALIGNYFSLDLSEFPKMTLQELSADVDNLEYVVQTADGKTNVDQAITTHLCVLYTGISNEHPEATTNTSCGFRNISFIGNGRRSDDPVDSGGILMNKNNTVNFYGYNTISNYFYIGYFFERGHEAKDVYTEPTNTQMGNFLIEDCKGYDFYQCAIYSFCANLIDVKTCEFKRCGGPAILVDNEQDDDGKNAEQSRINLIESTIESFVTGNEPWFATYDAQPIVATIKAAMEMLFNPTALEFASDPSAALIPDNGKTLFNKDNPDAINVVLVTKRAYTNGIDDMKDDVLHGYSRIFKSVQDYENYLSDSASHPVYGLDYDNEQLPGVKFGAYTVQDTKDNSYIVQSAQNGGFISTTNPMGMSSIVQGMVTMMVVNGAINQAADSNNMIASLKDTSISFAEGLPNKRLNEMYSVVDNQLNLLKIFATAFQPEQMQALYSGILNYQLPEPFNNLKAIQAIDGADQMSASALFNALASQVRAIYNASIYGVGDYVNLYANIALGAIIGIYDR